MPAVDPVHRSKSLSPNPFQHTDTRTHTACACDMYMTTYMRAWECNVSWVKRVHAVHASCVRANERIHVVRGTSALLTLDERGLVHEPEEQRREPHMHTHVRVKSHEVQSVHLYAPTPRPEEPVALGPRPSQPARAISQAEFRKNDNLRQL